ncbi:MAG TPA: glucose-1-phosphate adenylyltransferase [Candidatus Binatia bacterium]|nr:glucose-1-phosphate adenylyltransferase [Candidatus Binatia bacterium]
MKRVLAIILGGGAGTRLYPLTKLRAKPAVPLGAKYRLIDIPISNCINSEIQRIYVLTQFNSASLNRHITRTYGHSGISQDFVEVLAAQQTAESPSWFEGTADAVRKYVWLFAEWDDVDQYLILSGDHLYRMNYGDFIRRHRETEADITLSVVPVEEPRASDFGLMKIDESGRVTSFSEKPKGDALQTMRVDTTRLGLSPEKAREQPYIASMGIYVFERQALLNVLKSPGTDFGKEVIPAAAKDYNVRAYLFKDYWEDIGTIESFYHANLALTHQPVPPFSFYDEKAPIYTHSRHLPPTKLLDSHVNESMVGEGCILKECTITHSVIGIRSRIETDCVIHDALLMGADYYESPLERAQVLESGKVPLGIGANTTIQRAIVDKNARIGRNVRIVNQDGVDERNREELGFVIRNGIVVVIKNATIPDGTII